MPTGVALRDARERLFDAAERILLDEGPSALTSRAVTMEAGCAKGVLHRHFADFDGFLAEFVLDRALRCDAAGSALIGRAGTGTVTGNVAAAVTEVFASVAVAVVGLVASRDGLRARLRERWPVGVPVLTDAAEAVAAYLAAERDLGRLAPGAEPDGLAPAIIGTAHLIYADRTGPRPDEAAVHDAVRTVLAGSDLT